MILPEEKSLFGGKPAGRVIDHGNAHVFRYGGITHQALPDQRPRAITAHDDVSSFRGAVVENRRDARIIMLHRRQSLLKLDLSVFLAYDLGRVLHQP